jgi:hypothetical protein
MKEAPNQYFLDKEKVRANSLSITGNTPMVLPKVNTDGSV